VDSEEEAIEAGASDVELVEKNETSTEAAFFTAREELGSVRDQLIGRGWTIKVAELSFKPKNMTELNDQQKEEVYEFLNKLDDHGDTHRIYATV
jgi:transcriptional/translational regulatory protein YebC/TACO1